MSTSSANSSRYHGIKKINIKFLDHFSLHTYHLESTNIHMDQQSFQSLTNMLITLNFLYMIGFPSFIMAMLSIHETTWCYNPYFCMRFFCCERPNFILGTMF